VPFGRVGVLRWGGCRRSQEGVQVLVGDMEPRSAVCVVVEVPGAGTVR